MNNLFDTISLVNTIYPLSAFDTILKALSSGVAIAIYVCILSAILIWFVFIMMNRDTSAKKEEGEGGSKKATSTDEAVENEEEEGEEERKGRFCKLCHLDEIRSTIGRESYDENITLRQFCENFRN
ncbi:MAG: hypothetical protein IJ398_00035, partial [Clostridia bacterium]|nr:hypothetical protein [Clostridia bacterium]